MIIIDIHAKSQVNLTIDWKQADGRTDTTDFIKLLVNAVHKNTAKGSLGVRKTLIKISFLACSSLTSHAVLVQYFICVPHKTKTKRRTSKTLVSFI